VRRAAATFVLLALVLSSCGGDDAESPDSTSAVPADQVEATPTTTTAESADQAEATTTTAESADQAEAPFLNGFDRGVVLATAPEGGGNRPLLEWSSVSGADHYGVYLYAPSGKLYWSWRGRELSVYVGGAVQIGDHAAGPAVVVGMNWAVVAYDANLNPIAASGLRPIGP